MGGSREPGALATAHVQKPWNPCGAPTGAARGGRALVSVAVREPVAQQVEAQRANRGIHHDVAAQRNAASAAPASARVRGASRGPDARCRRVCASRAVPTGARRPSGRAGAQKRCWRMRRLHAGPPRGTHSSMFFTFFVRMAPTDSMAKPHCAWAAVGAARVSWGTSRGAKQPEWRCDAPA